MRKLNETAGLKLIFYLQFFVGVVCLAGYINGLYFQKPIRDFDSRQKRMQTDLEVAIPVAQEERGFLLDAVSEEMNALRSSSLAFSDLLGTSSACLLILSPIGLFLLYSSAGRKGSRT